MAWLRRFHYTMMAWLPTYFTDTLSLTLSQAAQVSLLPPIAAIATSALAGEQSELLSAVTDPASSGHDTMVVYDSKGSLTHTRPSFCPMLVSLHGHPVFSLLSCMPASTQLLCTSFCWRQRSKAVNARRELCRHVPEAVCSQEEKPGASTDSQRFALHRAAS